MFILVRMNSSLYTLLAGRPMGRRKERGRERETKGALAGLKECYSLPQNEESMLSYIKMRPGAHTQS